MVLMKAFLLFLIQILNLNQNLTNVYVKRLQPSSHHYNFSKMACTTNFYKNTQGRIIHKTKEAEALGPRTFSTKIINYLISYFNDPIPSQNHNTYMIRH